MINTEIGTIERFIYIEKEYNELLEKIEIACEIFCTRNINKRYEGWSFNQRKSLIAINYSFVNNGETEYESDYVSFEEIERIISENEPKIKQIEND